MKNQISEETAKGLIKVFEEFASSTPFATNQIEELTYQTAPTKKRATTLQICSKTLIGATLCTVIY